MQKQFGFRSLVFVNDFTANAIAIPALEDPEVRQIGDGILPRIGDMLAASAMRGLNAILDQQ